jgi:hypothetical protein
VSPRQGRIPAPVSRAGAAIVSAEGTGPAARHGLTEAERHAAILSLLLVVSRAEDNPAEVGDGTGPPPDGSAEAVDVSPHGRRDRTGDPELTGNTLDDEVRPLF